MGQPSLGAYLSRGDWGSRVINQPGERHDADGRVHLLSGPCRPGGAEAAWGPVALMIFPGASRGTGQPAGGTGTGWSER
jgi:hypothetical protein